MHQRLDVSHNDDRCGVQHPSAMLVLALMRRLANGLFMESRAQFPKPDHKTTTDFQFHFSAQHCRRSVRFLLLAVRPHFKSSS